MANTPRRLPHTRDELNRRRARLRAVLPSRAQVSAARDAVWLSIGVMILVGMLGWLLSAPVRVIAAPLLVAAAIVYLLEPVVARLEQRRVPRVLAVTLTYLVIVGTLATVVVLLAPTLRDQTETLAGHLPDMVSSFQGTVERISLQLGLGTPTATGPEGAQQVSEFVNSWLRGEQGVIQGVVSSAGNLARGMFHTLLTLALGPVLAFYLLVDLPRLRREVTRMVPAQVRDDVLHVGAVIGAKVGGYVRGQVAVSVFVAVLSTVGCLLVGLPFFAVVGVLAGVFNLVPLIGPFVGGAIGVFVALTAGEGVGQAIAVVVVMLVVQQLDNNVVSPLVMRRTVRLHPVTVMLLLLVAGTLGGIGAMVITVPAFASVKLVALHLLARAGYPVEGPVEPGEDEASSADPHVAH